MSAAFAAFNFSPAALPLPQLELVARILANLFRWVVLTPQCAPCPSQLRNRRSPHACNSRQRVHTCAQHASFTIVCRDQPALCEGFWAGDRRTGEPRSSRFFVAMPNYLALRSAPNPWHPHSPRAASPLSWRATDEPLRHFLDDLRGLYPAFPTLLHTLLAALSATADSGEWA